MVNKNANSHDHSIPHYIEKVMGMLEGPSRSLTQASFDKVDEEEFEYLRECSVSYLLKLDEIHAKF